MARASNAEMGTTKQWQWGIESSSWILAGVAPNLRFLPLGEMPFID